MTDRFGFIDIAYGEHSSCGCTATGRYNGSSGRVWQERTCGFWISVSAPAAKEAE